MKKLLGFLAASMIACTGLSAYGDNDDFDYDFSRINEIPVTKKIKPVETFMTPCRFLYCFYDHFDKNSPFSDLMEERWRLNKELWLGNISKATWDERVFSKYERSGKDFLITSIGGHWVVDNPDQSRIPYGAIMLNAIRVKALNDEANKQQKKRHEVGSNGWVTIEKGVSFKAW
ncbi:hypothetical protein EWZ91_04585 [Helicobacter pylori]|uniref:hypothetical protein n=1 Tax=Helicobacter pylori TaxID=210 RepID=UPI0009A36001|nr:hypothetical protein [Helicobacter pylori]NHA72739.1 hypothetical protein [Helicobacter pylori]OPG20743.1 hypothetical protein BGL62_05355 [Helicobacter pylori]QEF34454.1 hypothetical protein D2C79_08035 [Helicobacter pylori]